MRHYEIVLMIHPECSDQIISIINYYTKMVTNSGGKVHRVENWGRRQLAYSIKRLNKAYYILFNIEVSQNMCDELSQDFRFNEIVLRNLIIKTKYAIIDPSPMVKKKEENQENNVSDLQ